MNVSGDYHADPSWWAQTTAKVISNIHRKMPSVRQIALQPVVGGPGGARCPISSPDASQPFVRATYNYPYIKQGLAQLVGNDVVLGASPEVRSCGDYRQGDWAGHLTDAGAQAVGQGVAAFWARGAPAPAPAAAPAAAPVAAPAPDDGGAAPPADDGVAPIDDDAAAPEAAPSSAASAGWDTNFDNLVIQ